MRGLNIILLICMGLSFDEVPKGVEDYDKT
jgi:hypothetical protein